MIWKWVQETSAAGNRCEARRVMRLASASRIVPGNPRAGRLSDQENCKASRPGVQSSENRKRSLPVAGTSRAAEGIHATVESENNPRKVYFPSLGSRRSLDNGVIYLVNN